MLLRLLFILVAFAAAPAAAQAPLPGAGSPAHLTHGESHGWVALPATGPYQAVIFHLPPRIEQGQHSLGDGAVRLAATLPNAPEALAAWDNRVFMVFPPQPEQEGQTHRPRHVLTTAAVRGPIGGQWGPETEGRRMRALPSLPGAADLLAFAGTRHGPAALLLAHDEHGPRFRLLLLAGPSWRDLQLPEELLVRAEYIDPQQDRIGLVATEQGFGIFLAGARQQNPVMWLGRLQQPEDAVPAWSRRNLPLLAADGSQAPLPVGPIMKVAGQFVYIAQAQHPEGEMELWTFTLAESSLEAPRVWRLARLTGISAEWAAAPLDQVGRVAIVWAERTPARGSRLRPRADGDAARDDDTPTDEIRHSIAEVSVFTGAVLYEGAVRRRGPVSAQEMRLLVLVLVALMAVIIVFVLRPEVSGPPLTLPRGYALAEPGRRIAASMLDLVAAAFIAGQLTGVGVWELLTLRGILTADGGAGGVSAIIALVIVGFLMTTLAEGFAGKSLGKLLFGCEVVRPIVQRTAEGEPVPSVEPPGLRRAALRNLVKWTLPPVAMAGLGTMDRRHRGDLAGGTAVVIRIEEAETA